MTCLPLISVIVPVRNAALYLERCLDSIIDQSIRDIEIFCIYDDSSDRSWEILQSYAARDTRLHIVQENTGCLSCARNRGIAKARGQFLAFVDADDELFPHAFERLLPCLESGVDIVCFGTEEVVMHESTSCIRNSGYFDIQVEGKVKIDSTTLFKISWTVWNKIFRTELIKKFDITFPEKCQFEDNAFTLNSFVVCGEVFFLKETLYRYYRHEASLSAESSRGHNKAAFDYIHVLDHVYKFWKSHQLLSRQMELFEKISIRLFRSAIQVCLSQEKAGIVWEMVKRLQEWALPLDDARLRQLRDGDYSIRLGSGIGSVDVERMKKLRGLQRLLYLGTCRDSKILLLFGCCVAKWKKGRASCPAY